MVPVARSNSRRKKPILGDVFEIETASGLGYIQYAGKSSVYGELIRVFSTTHPKRPCSFETILDEPEAFLIFYPIPYAISRGLVEWVCHGALPERFRIFPMMRARSAVSPERETRWALFDGTDFSKFVELTPEIAKLSVAQVANYGSIQRKIETCYRPEMDV